MRSEYVFAAVREINNRFMLCRVTSVSARRLHIDSTQPSETINKSLKLIAAGEGAGTSAGTKNVSESANVAPVENALVEAEAGIALSAIAAQ
ncbi:MAG TPA: hypothetical protein VFP59_06100 [Candidatus Angelobacter sp.]|nr:hypothetical protein [Candidatus Angelobacter sp.]